MRVLVTGAAGFVGRHLARELARNGHEVAAFDRNYPAPVAEAAAVFTGDICDGPLVSRVVAEARCDACVHLSGIAFVPACESDPALMFSINVNGTINLLEAFRSLPAGPRILVVSTGHVYGAADGPVDERCAMAPATKYAISKAAADMMSLTYARQYGMHVMTARPNTHTGPGQSDKFFVPAFASQIKALRRAGTPSVLTVGNLDSTRDITDVRDVAEAYRLLLEKGRPGEAYNISSRNTLTVREVLERLCRLADVRPEIRIDQARFRPTDGSPILDTTKIETHAGWKPRIGLDRTLADVLSEA